MAQNKAMLQTILRTLENQNRHVQLLTKKVDDVQEQLKAIQPQSYLHPIPKPRQGKEFSRSTSVAGWLFEAIEDLNERIPNGQQKYLQFPHEIDYRRLNSDCIRELEGLLMYHIPDLCGYLTWEEACGESPKDCERIIREARVLPELAVFAQAAGQWALRMLCANKMRTMIATNAKKKSSKVKDLNQNNVVEHATGLDHNAPETLNVRPVEFDEIGNDSEPQQFTEGVAERSFDGYHQEEEVADEFGEVEAETTIDQQMENLGCSEALHATEEQAGVLNKGGSELLTDFPEIEESITPRGQEEITADRVEPRDEIEQNPPPATRKNLSENISSLAQIQNSAQVAAKSLLSGRSGSAYRHRRVFNNLDSESGPNGNEDSRSVAQLRADKRASGVGVKKKASQRTKTASTSNVAQRNKDIAEIQMRKSPRNKKNGVPPNDTTIPKQPMSIRKEVVAQSRKPSLGSGKTLVRRNEPNVRVLHRSQSNLSLQREGRLRMNERISNPGLQNNASLSEHQEDIQVELNGQESSNKPSEIVAGVHAAGGDRETARCLTTERGRRAAPLSPPATTRGRESTAMTAGTVGRRRTTAIGRTAAIRGTVARGRTAARGRTGERRDLAVRGRAIVKRGSQENRSVPNAVRGRGGQRRLSKNPNK